MRTGTPIPLYCPGCGVLVLIPRGEFRYDSPSGHVVQTPLAAAYDFECPQDRTMQYTVLLGGLHTYTLQKSIRPFLKGGD